MSLLQRNPIDVSVGIGCPRPEGQDLYVATQRLLEASTGMRPFVGAIVRGAIRKPELEAMLDKANGEAAIAGASFLEPANQAMQDWWKQHRLDSHYGVKDLAIGGMKNGDLGLKLHMDQSISVPDGKPQFGPLSALAMLTGSVEYRLGVKRKNPFNGRHVKNYFNATHPTLDPRTSAVIARQGDVLLFTNTPPTFHESHPLTQRSTAIYFSRFVAVETV